METSKDMALYTYCHYEEFCPTPESRIFWLLGIWQGFVLLVDEMPDTTLAIAEFLGIFPTLVIWLARYQYRRDNDRPIRAGDDIIGGKWR